MATETFTMDDAKRILVERVGMNEADVPDDPEATFDLDGATRSLLEIQLAMQQEYGLDSGRGRFRDLDAGAVRGLREPAAPGGRLRMAAHTDNSVVVGRSA